MLFSYEWELTESPAGAKQWKPRNPEAQELVPDAHIEGKKNPPMMATTDMALIMDPGFREISERFYRDPEYFADQYARAWFKLLHRDWSAAASYRGTDMRGGANGARLRLEPQIGWAVNAGVQDVLPVFEQVKGEFEQQTGKRVSLADLIVLGGTAAVEKAAADAGVPVTVPFHPGRTDASQQQTDVDNARWL